ncbi:mucin-13-like isoform X5 [Scyliorhinus torazame]|uniref:mucin-13-like isoform X5 n=1 Tax=Scyliorhinus torazame TaxID=75743 RepID=UPI003B5C5B36
MFQVTLTYSVRKVILQGIILGLLYNSLCAVTESTTPISAEPSSNPTTVGPSSNPNTEPSSKSTAEPSANPPAEPSANPPAEPSSKSTAEPSANPPAEPSSKSTAEPSSKSTAEPSANPPAEPSSKSTAEPSSKSTAEPSSKSTAEPSSKSTAEPSANPTAEPSANPTAGGPPSNSTTGPSSNPTGGELPSNATVAPSITDISEITIPTTTGSSCSSNPCGDTAECVDLFDGFTCECNFDFYYDNDTNICIQGQSFGGQLTIQMEFDETMKDTRSQKFAELRKSVTSFFNSSFAHIEGYKTTLILDVRSGSVITAVTHTFIQDTNVNDEVITQAIKNAIEGNSNYSYYSVPGCKVKKCDKETTSNCFQEPRGLLAECICKIGFYKTNVNETTCRDSCHLNCDGRNEYIVRSSDHKCECKCLPGYKIINKECERCPFGYNGVDCKDGFQLTTLVIGVVLGIALLGVTIGLIYACIRLKHVDNGEHEHLLNEQSNTGGHQMKIPRVNMGIDSMKKQSPEWNEMSNQGNKYENHAMEYEIPRGRRY